MKLLKINIVSFLLVLSGMNISLSQNSDKPAGLKVNYSIFDISAGMGVKAVYFADIVDFINSLGPAAKENKLSIVPEFFISPELAISNNLSLKFEYAYLIKTYNEQTNIGQMTVECTLNAPTLILHYLIREEGYFIKFGGGVGYHFGAVGFQYFTTDKNYYYSEGIGIKADLTGQTMLSDHVYFNLSANLQADFLSELKNKAGVKIPDYPNKVSMDFIGAGVSMGLAYYF